MAYLPEPDDFDPIRGLFVGALLGAVLWVLIIWLITAIF